MAPKNLQEVIDAAASPVELLRNSQIGSYIYPVVPADFQNWIKEQKAWRDTAVLYDQSHHMDNLFLKGSDAIKLISDTAINSTAVFPVDKAKQYVPTTAAGHVIGDGILFREAEDEYVYVGRAPASNWLLYHGETGGYSNLDIEIDRRSPSRPYGHEVTRQLLPLPDPGPERVVGHREAQRRPARAAEVLQHVDHDDRRHHRAHAPPRHGRRTGPRDLGSVRRPRPHLDRDRRGRRRVRARPGRLARLPVEHARVGLDPLARCRRSTPAPRSAATASGCPPTATRRPARSPARSSPTNIEDYYLTPWELGYGNFVKFDHDFIGRDALEKIDPAIAAQEGHARVGCRGPRQGLDVAPERRRPELQVLRPAAGELRLGELRLGRGRGRHGRRLLDVHRLQRQRAPRPVARDGRPERARGHRAQGRLGRAERRHHEGERRAARADRGARRGQPRAVLDRRPRDLPGRLAHQYQPA